MSKLKYVLSIIAIMISNIAVMSYFGPPQVVADVLYGIFPEQGVTYLLSGPALFFIVGSLVAPILLKRMSGAVLLKIVVIAAALCGYFGAAIPDITYMSILASVLGLCGGICNVTGLALLAKMFIDDKKRASMVGIYNSCMAIAAAGISFIVGFLVSTEWVQAWNVSLIAIPEVVLVLFFTPRFKRDYESDSAETAEAATAADAPAESVSAQAIVAVDGAAKPRKGYGASFWIIIVELLAYTLLFNAPFMTLVALTVTELGLGDGSLIGAAIAITTGGNFCFNLFFGFFYPKIKRIGIVPACALGLAGIALLLFVPSVPTLIVAEFISGVGYGLAFSWVLTYPTTMVAPEQISSVNSIGVAVATLGQFGTAYLATAFMAILGTSGALVPTFPIYLVAFTLVGAADIVFGIRDTRKAKAAATPVKEELAA